MTSQTTSPPSLAAPDQDAAGDFRIQTPAEILQLLQGLQREQTRISLHGANGACVQSCLSAVNASEASLGFDAHRQDPQLQALLSADEVTAVAYLDQIKLQFELDGLMLLNSPQISNGTVLRAPLPGTMYRFQRRQAFRVRPNTRTPQARLPDPQAPEQQLRLRILDLSLGGLALLWPEDQPPPAIGTPIASAQIELDRDTRFEASLRVQNSRADPDGGLHLGLVFERIDADAQRSLQRFVDQMQKLGRLLSKRPAAA